MIIIFIQYILLKSESILNKCYVEFCIVFSFFLFFVLCTTSNDESIDA